MKPTVFTALVDLLPEAMLVLGAVVCLVLAAARRRSGIRTYQAVSGAALLAAIGMNFAYLRGMPAGGANPGYLAFGGGLVVDRFTLFMTATLCAFSLLTVLLGTLLSDRIRTHLGEYHAFLLLATLGAVLLVSTREMISLWVAAELLSVALVLLVGTVKTSRLGGEAAVKQLVLGVASSGVLLYGLALLYGVGGSTDLVEVAHTATHPNAALVLAMALTLLGLLGKVGIVPYQRLLPDVLQGAPAPVAGLLASLGVAAVMGLFLRTVVTAFPAVRFNWQALVAAAAALTMLYGSLLAVRQRSVRRVVAHLALAQLGVVLLGVLGLENQGVATVMFSLFTGGVAVIAAAAAITLVEGSGTSDTLAGYEGLSRRSPGVALTLSLAVLSLAGLPPLIGFFGRVFTVEAAVMNGWAWLLAVALPATVVGAVAAVRLVRTLFVAAADEDALPLDEPASARTVLTVCGVAVVGLAAAVQPLLALAGAGAGAVVPH
ncbi:MAG TPA: proton-conducting transporter membrane subunit [Candidatus Dormibacteraeota bacterium]|nr:proton-conducting transporter membrane subunit [Candidatus Dormibacteraeota bacterium]